VDRTARQFCFMNTDITKAPAVQIKKDTFLNMCKRLNAEQVGYVMMAVFAHFVGVDGPKLEEIEDVYYDEIVSYAEEKVQSWLNQGSNFRNNNPRKKNQQK